MIRHAVARNLSSKSPKPHCSKSQKPHWTYVHDSTIVQCHEDFLNFVFTRFQSQPRNHDEYCRYNFVVEMQLRYMLYCDGKLLWTCMPEFPDDKDGMYFYEKNVTSIISQTYETLIKSIITLETIIILHILERFFCVQDFKGALNWVCSIDSMPYHKISFPKI